MKAIALRMHQKIHHCRLILVLLMLLTLILAIFTLIILQPFLLASTINSSIIDINLDLAALISQIPSHVTNGKLLPSNLIYDAFLYKIQHHTSSRRMIKFDELQHESIDWFYHPDCVTSGLHCDLPGFRVKPN